MTLQFVLNCALYFFIQHLAGVPFLRCTDKKGSGDRSDLMLIACDLSRCCLVPCILPGPGIAYFSACFPDLEETVPVMYRHCLQKSEYQFMTFDYNEANT